MFPHGNNHLGERRGLGEANISDTSPRDIDRSGFVLLCLDLSPPLLSCMQINSVMHKHRLLAMHAAH
jgi:hypothetical protein